MRLLIGTTTQAWVGLLLGLWAATAPLAARQDSGSLPLDSIGVASADSLHLDELIDEALAYSPRLVALRAMAEAVEHRVPESGTPPDPMVSLGAMNLGLPEFDAGMPASMLPSIQLSQTLPFFGKLGLRREVAETEREAARALVQEEEWRVRLQVSEHFHALYAMDRILEVHRRTLDLLQDFQSVARSLYASGTGRQGDVLRADVEVARMDAEIRRISALRTAQAAQLNAVLDRPGESPVPFPSLPSLPTSVPTLDTLLAWSLESRPALARQRLQVERARASVALADRELWPDFTITAQYGRRGGPDPRSMGGLMIGASVPVFSGSRQRPRVEAARALERQATSQASEVRAAVESELRTAAADLDRARRLMGLYRDEILPAASVNVSSSLAAYRVGEVDFPTLVDAQLDVDQFEEEYHQLVADYGAAVARLEAAVGRRLPAPTEPLPAGFLPE
ncbi:MAG: TolC family protein [Gemmatimonadales bacterium]|nr:MAG: TolC family protein [Gemmatimonadales bacterium]